MGHGGGASVGRFCQGIADRFCDTVIVHFLLTELDSEMLKSLPADAVSTTAPQFFVVFTVFTSIQKLRKNLCFV